MLVRMCALLCLLLAQRGWSASLPDLIERVRPSIVAVGTAYPPRQPLRTGERMTYRGTGFVVSDGRHVITNLHVLPAQLDVNNKQSLAVFSGHGKTATAHTAKEVRRDEEHDLVLLEIFGSKLPALSLADSSTVREGQDIALIGFPLGMVLGLYPVTHRGIVSAITPMAQPLPNSRGLDSIKLRRMRDHSMSFQLDAIAYPGNSGSPVFELEGGKVIGVVNSVVVKETKETMLTNPSGISYAIPASFVERLLKSE
jgi:serine protease Do